MFKNPFQKWQDRLHRVDIFCLEDVPEYQQAECGIESGGIIAVGLIDPDEAVGANDAEKITNLENEVWWADGMGASPATHWVMLETRGSKAAATPTEEEGFGLVATEVTGADEEFVFESLNIKDNRDFVAAVNKRRNWKAVFVTAEKDSDTGGYHALYAEDVNFFGSILIEQSIKSRKRWSWSAKQATDTTPQLPFVAPASIFTR